MRKAFKSTAFLLIVSALSLLWGGVSLYAQNSCTGKVVDSQGEPVISASVLIKDAPVSTGTVTDFDGTFVQSNAKVGDVLVISSIGYATKEIQWNGQVLSIVLEDDQNLLDKVVVTGYGGTQLRSKVTNSISKVEEKALQVGSYTNVGAALSGAVSGLRVIQNSGDPNAAPQIVLRGGTNLNGTGSPLVIVDGQLRDSMADINSSDIESIDVLKDAGATALYGARASNGVILITTKKGHEGVANITFKAKVGLNYAYMPVEFCDAKDYIFWMRRTYRDTPWAAKTSLSAVQPYGLGATAISASTQYNILRKTDENAYLLEKGWSEMKDPLDENVSILYKDTNIQKYNLNNPSVSQDYNASITGGNNRGTYYAGIGYNDTQGLPMTTFYKRLSFLFNGSYKITDWLTSNSSVNFARTKYRSLTGTNASESNYFGRTMSTPPTIRVEDEDGKPLLGNGTLDGNQSYQADKFIRDFENDKLTLSESLSARLTRDLTLNVSGSWYYNEDVNEQFNKDFQTNQAGTTFNRTRSSAANFTRYFTQTYNGTLQYKHSFADAHNLDALVGMEYYDRSLKYFGASGEGASTDDFQDLGLTTTAEGKRKIDSQHSQYRIMSFFGRVNYDYMGKYLASFTFREDGYSALLDNRWGFFPGVSAGWIFGNEDFVRNAIPALSFGKLRASYGINGNASGIGAYDLQGSYSAQTAYDGNIGFLIGTLPNPSLRWEKTTTYEVGADVSFFQNRLNLNMTYYNRLTDDKYANLTLPSTTGFSSVKNNNGQLRNQGFELEISGKILQKKDFSWTGAANINYNKNTIVKLPDNKLERNRQDAIEVYVPGSYNPTTGKSETMWIGGYQEGQEPGAIVGYRVVGLAHSASDFPAGYINKTENYFGRWQYGPDEWAKYIAGGGSPDNAVELVPGDLIYEDINGDGIIDMYDQVVLGHAMPHWIGGFNTTLTWKGLSLYGRFDFALGHSLANALANDFYWFMGCMQGTYNMPVDVWDTVSDLNPNGKYPRYTWADQFGACNYYRQSSFTVNNGSYLAIRELSLSYVLPQKLTEKIKCKRIELSITGQNLGYITAATKVYSPESGGNIGTTYALPRTLLFGANITF